MNQQVRRSHTLQSAKLLCDRFYRDESGQDLIEYALLAALVASSAVAGTQNLASSIANQFTNISTALANAIPSQGGGNGGNTNGGNNGGNGGGGGRRGRRGGGGGGFGGFGGGRRGRRG